MAQASLAVKRETENSSDDSLEAAVKGMVSIRIQRSASMVTTASVTPILLWLARYPSLIIASDLLALALLHCCSVHLLFLELFEGFVEK